MVDSGEARILCLTNEKLSVWRIQKGTEESFENKKIKTPTKMMIFLPNAAFAMTSGIDMWERRNVLPVEFQF
jgi:hypothetical protein